MESSPSPWKSADAKLQPRVTEGRSWIARLSLR